MTSTCVFPDKIAYPITEDQIHDGAPHSSNEGYAYAKVRVALQHTATHCNTLQHTATHCYTLQHTATHCYTLLHTATRCNTHDGAPNSSNESYAYAKVRVALQHTATHCNIHDGDLHSSNEGYAYAKVRVGVGLSVCL